MGGSRELSGAKSYFYAFYSQILGAFFADMFHVKLTGLFPLKFITGVDLIRTEGFIESGSRTCVFANLNMGIRINKYLYSSKLFLESRCAWMEIIRLSLCCNS
jgi:hypothetical protein